MLYTSVGIMILAILMMAVGYQWRKPAMAIASGMAWIIAGLINYNLSVGLWDIYYGVFWFCIGMTIISIMETLSVVVSNRKQAQDDNDSKKENPEDDESMDGYYNTMKKHRESLGAPKKKEEHSDYDKTGRY